MEGESAAALQADQEEVEILAEEQAVVDFLCLL